MEKPAAAVFAEAGAFSFLSIAITESVNKFAPEFYRSVDETYCDIPDSGRHCIYKPEGFRKGYPDSRIRFCCGNGTSRAFSA